MQAYDPAPYEFSLADHQIIASPQMDCIYVINTTVSETDPNPQIVKSYPMAIGSDAPEGQKAGVSISLRVAGSDSWIRIDRGDTLSGDPENTIRSGHVVVEILGYHTQTTNKRVTSFLNSASIDKANQTVVAGGIGISDILSGDPLLVTLVSAPLTTTLDEDGGSRQVRGVYIDYVDFDTIDFTHGPYTAKVWGFNTVLVPSGAL